MCSARTDKNSLLEELAYAERPKPRRSSGLFRTSLILLLLPLLAFFTYQWWGDYVGFEIFSDVQNIAETIPSEPSTSETPDPSTLIRTAAARPPDPLTSSETVLDATGYVVARRQAAVSSKITGKVAEIFVEEGSLVEVGQLLARLDDLVPKAEHELAVAQYEDARLATQELRIRLAQSRRDLNRILALAEKGFASAATREEATKNVATLSAQLARARQAVVVAERHAAVKEQILADTEIRAPFAGIVTSKTAQPGEMISPVSAGGGFTRTGICKIVDMDSLEVEVDINESLIYRVHVDQPVGVVLNSYAEKQFPAEVVAIIPAADRNRATIRVRIGLLERDPRILPGMGVRVSFTNGPSLSDSVGNSQLQIPRSAVGQAQNGSQYVYVVVDGEVSRRIVETDKSTGSAVNVLSGLAEGELVVVNPSPDLDQKLANGEDLSLLF